MLQPGDVVLNNTHIDTTRANIEFVGAEARDLPHPSAAETASSYPFKGNMDVALLEKTLIEEGDRVPLVMVTITNNSVGGQPVSLENLRAVRAVCDRYGKPLFLDACRFAENAWFIKLREPGQSERTPREIAEEMFYLADGCTMSAKKDGLANIGGFLDLDDDRLAGRCKTLLVLGEGFPTYGGLAGRDLEVIATGLEEVTDEDYLADRIGTTTRLANAIAKQGVPVVLPAGGHAVYLDAGALLPHIPHEEFPGVALVNAIYVAGGIRGSEIGSAMFGSGRTGPAAKELVRLALPRRVYTHAHLDYVAEVVGEVARTARSLSGYRIVEAPQYLRHFQATYEAVTREELVYA
jgi:tryptophanase